MRGHWTTLRSSSRSRSFLLSRVCSSVKLIASGFLVAAGNSGHNHPHARVKTLYQCWYMRSVIVNQVSGGLTTTSLPDATGRPVLCGTYMVIGS